MCASAVGFYGDRGEEELDESSAAGEGFLAELCQAWETEAALVYHDVAWYLYGELWEVTEASRPELSFEQRKTFLDQLLKPIVDPKVEATAKSAVLVRFFQIALAARVWPLLQGAADSGS